MYIEHFILLEVLSKSQWTNVTILEVGTTYAYLTGKIRGKIEK